MRNWIDIAEQWAKREREILAVMRLGDRFAAEGTVIADTRDRSVRYFIPADAPTPTDEDVEAIEQMASESDEDGIVQLLLTRGILKIV